MKIICVLGDFKGDELKDMLSEIEAAVETANNKSEEKKEANEKTGEDESKIKFARTLSSEEIKNISIEEVVKEVEQAQEKVDNKPEIIKGYTIDDMLDIGYVGIPTEEVGKKNAYDFVKANSYALYSHGEMVALMKTDTIEETTMLERARMYRSFLGVGAKLKEFLLSLLPDEFKKYSENVNFDLSRIGLNIHATIFDEFAPNWLRVRGESFKDDFTIYLPELEITKNTFTVATNFTIRERIGLSSLRRLNGEKGNEQCHKICVSALDRNVRLTYGAEESIIRALRRQLSSDHVNMSIYETAVGCRILFERVFQSNGVGKIYGPEEIRKSLLQPIWDEKK